MRKACAPNRRERYESAREMLADVKALQKGDIIKAGQKPLGYLSLKLLRRHWLPVVFATLVITALLSIAVLNAQMAAQENEARQEVEESLAKLQLAEAQAKRDASDAQLVSGIAAFRNENFGKARELLRLALEIWPENEDAQYTLSFLESIHRSAEKVPHDDVEFEVVGIKETHSGFVLHGAKGEEATLTIEVPEKTWEIEDILMEEAPGMVTFRSKESGQQLLSPLRYGTGRETMFTSLRFKKMIVARRDRGIDLWDFSNLGPSYLERQFDGLSFFMGYTRESDDLWVVNGEGKAHLWQPKEGIVKSIQVMDIPMFEGDLQSDGTSILHNYMWQGGQGNFRGYKSGLRTLSGHVHLFLLSRITKKHPISSLLGRESDNAMMAVEDGRVGALQKSGFYKWLSRRDYETEFMAMGAGGSVGAILEDNDTVTIVDTNISKVQRSWKVDEPSQHIAILDGGKLCVLAGDDGGLRCFDVATGERVGKTIRLLKKGSDAAKIRVVPVPNREEVMVSVEGDLRIQRWNVRTGEDLTQGMLHELDVFWFGCLPGGEIGISIDQSIKNWSESDFRVWSLRTGNELVPSLHFSHQILWVAAEGKGKRIAISLADSSVRRWVVDDLK